MAEGSWGLGSCAPHLAPGCEEGGACAGWRAGQDPRHLSSLPSEAPGLTHVNPDGVAATPQQALGPGPWLVQPED